MWCVAGASRRETSADKLDAIRKNTSYARWQGKDSPYASWYSLGDEDEE